jgi:hypothetical protein
VRTMACCRIQRRRAANGLPGNPSSGYFPLALRRSTESWAVLLTFTSRLHLRLGLRSLLGFAFSSIFISHALSLPCDSPSHIIFQHIIFGVLNIVPQMKDRLRTHRAR